MRLSRAFPAGCLDGARVLVVDDDHDGLALACTILVRAGAEVTGAERAAPALDMLRSRPIDLLLSDIGMPEMDGYEFIREARAGGYEGRAVAFTAFGHASDRSRALKAGFDEHLAKPLDAERLVGALVAVWKP